MEEFLRSYGLWILLGAIFVAMHWFGGGCGASHGRGRSEDRADRRPEDDKQQPAHAGRRAGRCH